MADPLFAWNFPYAISKYAMYCVRNEYLAPGKLDKKIFSSSGVTLYSISPKDPTIGYEGSGLFHALPGQGHTQEQLDAVEVWVPSMSHFYFVPDDVFPE